MSSYNRIMLMGNLTRDPEMTYTPSQTAVTKFGMAVNKKWTGKDGQAQEKVCFVDCVAFGKTAETINKFFSKGEPIFVEGELELDNWTAQDGTKRSKHKVSVQRFCFVGSKEKQGRTGQGSSGSDAPF